MIGNILSIIAREVSEFIDGQSEFPTGKKSVILHKPKLDNNELDIPDNTISLSLFNIEEDLTQRSAVVEKRVINGKVYKKNPPVNLHLYVIFLPKFPNDYESELNYTTKIIEFFQQKNTFTSEDTKGLDELNVDKLVFKLDNIPLASQSGAFWNLLSAKYLPYVIYRVSTLVIQEQDKLTDTKLVKEVDIDVQHKKLKP